MPEPTTAPVPADDLRARLTEALFRHAVTVARPTPFPPAELEGTWLATVRENAAARADAVIAELVALCDPGDLPARMAEAMRAARDQWVSPEDETNASEVGEHFAIAAMGVRDEQMASLAAENAQLRARLDEAAGNADAYGQKMLKAQAERDQAKRAVYTARITHVREAHPNRPVVGDCGVCRAFVALDRAMPKRPDDPEEIRRLAQATTEEMADE